MNEYERTINQQLRSIMMVALGKYEYLHLLECGGGIKQLLEQIAGEYVSGDLILERTFAERLEYGIWAKSKIR